MYFKHIRLSKNVETQISTRTSIRPKTPEPVTYTSVNAIICFLEICRCCKYCFLFQHSGFYYWWKCHYTVTVCPSLPHFKAYSFTRTCTDPEGGPGGLDPPPPLKSNKNIGFLTNTGPDPLKNYKATKPDSMLGRHRHANETSFKWCFTGGPMMARL